MPTSQSSPWLHIHSLHLLKLDLITAVLKGFLNHRQGVLAKNAVIPQESRQPAERVWKPSSMAGPRLWFNFFSVAHFLSFGLSPHLHATHLYILKADLCKKGWKKWCYLSERKLRRKIVVFKHAIKKRPYSMSLVHWRSSDELKLQQKRPGKKEREWGGSLPAVRIILERICLDGCRYSVIGDLSEDTGQTSLRTNISTAYSTSQQEKGLHDLFGRVKVEKTWDITQIIINIMKRITQ